MEAAQQKPVATVESGSCWVLCILDIGYAIDIEKSQTLCSLPTERLRLKAKQRTPEEFDYHPPPLRITQATFPITLGRFKSSSDTEITVYDFGALAVSFRFPIAGASFSELVAFSAIIDQDETLRQTAREVAENILSIVSPAVERPKVSGPIEDYVIWEVTGVRGSPAIDELLRQEKLSIAQMIRADDEDLSVAEIQEALSYRMSYSGTDIVIVDWNGAFLLGTEMDAVLAVLEFANVELLEMRLLDEQLDHSMEEARAILAKGVLSQSALRRVGHLQLDGALLFEAINNALKLVGDHYLARLYYLASRSLHLEDRDSIVLRKLNVIRDIYSQMESAASARRMEIMEFVIICLFAVSVILQIFRW